MTPSPSPTPVEPSDGGAPLLVWVLVAGVLVAGGAAVVYLVMRRPPA